MGDNTAIEWTDATWNPVTGCTKVSPGCDHCYAENLAERFRGTPGHYFENGFDVQLRPDKLVQPLRWSKPRRVFVDSMSDLFHDEIPDNFIAEVFAVMALASQHTFQVLTKRAGRMRALLNRNEFLTRVCEVGHGIADRQKLDGRIFDRGPWPLPNVWLGVSTENQKWADIRIPQLLDTPAAVRFISAEPLLGEVMLPLAWLHRAGHTGRVDWVIAGGESGRGARPVHPDWVRTLRDQCVFTGTPFHFKQWGEWKPYPRDSGYFPAHFVQREDGRLITDEQFWGVTQGHWNGVQRVGKKKAGRELDGRMWDQTPSVVRGGIGE
ncbi:hypothetical protein CH267_00870 [Rhodococcus sp. 06-621-2]|nr:phage Gp37/Gp68 family protein [Rhodococcus sp. 06-621-2]OZC62126.1 hypothetical protein CH267_00870 [Rhodococcus sp. 06-621-2]